MHQEKTIQQTNATNNTGSHTGCVKSCLFVSGNVVFVEDNVHELSVILHSNYGASVRVTV